MASESQNLSAVTEGRNSASPGTDTCLFFCHDVFFFPLTTSNLIGLFGHIPFGDC